jgi:hypothetical protein
MAKGSSEGLVERLSPFLSQIQEKLSEEEDNRRFTFKSQRIPWKTAVLFSMVMRATNCPGNSVARVLKTLLETAMSKSDQERLLSYPMEEMEAYVLRLFTEVHTKGEIAKARAQSSSRGAAPLEGRTAPRSGAGAEAPTGTGDRG